MVQKIGIRNTVNRVNFEEEEKKRACSQDAVVRLGKEDILLQE